MSNTTTLTTDRLRLVPCAPDHLDGLFRLNSNPDVMRYIRAPQTRDEVAAWISATQERWARFGFGWWSLFEMRTDEIIGAACLQHLAHIETNPLEIGWRLIPEAQGRGYATEAGRAAMNFGFDQIGENRLMAVADPENTASTRVMERLGMRYLGIQTHYDVPCATYEIEKADENLPE